MSVARVLKESLLLLGFMAVGLFALPALIFVVGQFLVGEYEGGLSALYLAIADALAAGNRFAWVLVASPYLTILLARFWLRLGRRRQTVTEITESTSS